MKFQPRPRFEALAVRSKGFKTVFLRFLGLEPLKPPEAPGAPWNGPEAPRTPLHLIYTIGLQYILCLIYGFRVLGALN